MYAILESAGPEQGPLTAGYSAFQAAIIGLTKCDMPCQLQSTFAKHQSQQASKHKQVRGKHLGLVDRNIPCKVNLGFTNLACRYETDICFNHAYCPGLISTLLSEKLKDNKSGCLNKSHSAEILTAKTLPLMK